MVHEYEYRDLRTRGDPTQHRGQRLRHHCIAHSVGGNYQGSHEDRSGGVMQEAGWSRSITVE
jgi:hypothetical protein